MEIKHGTVFVTTTDTFMSGWGKAEGLTNKLIFLCDSMDQARTVADNAEARSDQKRVKIHTKPPTYLRKTKGKDYVEGDKYVQIKTIEDYPSWYEKNYFRNLKKQRQWEQEI